MFGTAPRMGSPVRVRSDDGVFGRIERLSFRQRLKPLDFDALGDGGFDNRVVEELLNARVPDRARGVRRAIRLRLL